MKNEDFEALVVGSDQIWRPVLFKNIEDAFFDFARDWNVRRIAYAASFGVDTWEYSHEQTLNCEELIQMFDAVSVREKSGVDLCRNILGRYDTEWVLDPTMLLEREDYISLIQKGDVSESSGDLFYYILDETSPKKDIIVSLSNDLGYKPFKVSAPIDDFSLPAEQRVQPPVEKWLAAFRDAKFIVTDSFHACVFSILFQKQFVVIANQFRGSARMQSLLEMFGLQERMVNSIDDIKNMGLIDYEVVFKALCSLRQKSIAFLYQALNG